MNRRNWLARTGIVFAVGMSPFTIVAGDNKSGTAVPIQMTFAQEQKMLLDYVLSLQIASGGYRSHVNLGIIPGPKTTAYEVDPWRTMLTGTALLRSNYRLDLTVPSALRAAKWFLANRQADGGPPDRQWVDATGKVLARTSVDAQDSADAAFLELCCELRRAAPKDTQVLAFLNSNRAAIFSVAYDLVKLADTDGLFWTFSRSGPRWVGYPGKLLAGNSEDVSALWRFSNELASKFYGDAVQAKYYLAFSVAGQTAILRDLVRTTASEVRIVKWSNGTYQGLSSTPNWDSWDKYPASFLINQGIIQGNSALAQNLLSYLSARHPNWTTKKPATALTYDSELGITLVLSGDLNGAVVFTRTILDNVFAGSQTPKDGYFLVNDVASLLQVTAMTGRTRPAGLFQIGISQGQSILNSLLE